MNSEKTQSDMTDEVKKASEEYCPDDAYPFAPEIFRKELRKAFIAGYKYHEEHTPLPEDSVAFNKGVEEGKRLMVEEAVEGTIVDAGFDEHTALVSIPDKRYDEGDKVRVIILKEKNDGNGTVHP